MKLEREFELSRALATADFAEARRLAKWVLLLECGHESYTCIHPRFGFGHASCNRPGCSLSPEFTVPRGVVGVRRLSRRERRSRG